jgi:hypothetical protein
MCAALGAVYKMLGVSHLISLEKSSQERGANVGSFTWLPITCPKTGAHFPGDSAARVATRGKNARDGLAVVQAWPRARRHVVQVGRELSNGDVAGAAIHIHPLAFGKEARIAP